MRIGRIALLTVSLLGLTGAAVFAGPAGKGYRTSYYDATGEVVGGAFASCGGQYSSWGTRTSTYDRVFFSCD